MDLNRWVVIIGIVVAYFIISMFMDEIPLLLLTLQLTFPLITSLGFDPIWFGVLSMMMVAMGLVFPPVGLLAFVVSATAGVDLMKVYKGSSILMLAIVVDHRAADDLPGDRALAAARRCGDGPRPRLDRLQSLQVRVTITRRRPLGPLRHVVRAPFCCAALACSLPSSLASLPEASRQTTQRRNPMTCLSFVGALLAAVVLPSASATADSYPDRPIRVIASQGPGA